MTIIVRYEYSYQAVGLLALSSPIFIIHRYITSSTTLAYW